MKSLKSIFLVLLSFCFCQTLWAQTGNGEKVRQAKLVFIADRLNLSEEASKEFWPLFEKYENEVRGLRRIYREKFQQTSGLKSKVEEINFIYNNPSFKKSLAQVRKHYDSKFISVIGADKFGLLRKAEEDFRQELLSNFSK